MLQSSNYRWAVLFASFLTFVAFAFVFQLAPPLLMIISENFGVSEAESGWLMSMVVVPGIFLALPVGLFVNRYGFRVFGFLSTVLVALGSLTTALAGSFLTVLLGRFVLGVGGVFIIVGMPTLIPQWFPQRDIGKAMGVYGTSMPVGTITAFPIATLLEQLFDWHYPFFLGAIVAFAAALIFAVTVREGQLKGENKLAGIKEVKSALKKVEVWKVSIVWMFFNATALAYLSWAKILFQDFKGLEPLYASVLASVLMYAAVVFGPIYGWVSDKIGRRKPFMVVGMALFGLTLIATSYASDLTLLLSVIVLGVTASMVPSMVMIITAESLPQNLSGTGFSIVTLCQNIGITIAAPVAGYLIQTTRSLSLTFLGISFFAFAGAITALTLKTK